MSEIFNIATESLLTPLHLNEHQLESVLGTALGNKVDRADLFLQHSVEESWYLENGFVKEGSFHIDRGFGLHAVSGEKTGFAYADDINLLALNQAAKAAKSIAYSGGHKSFNVMHSKNVQPLYSDINPLQTYSAEEKVLLLQKLDQMARAMDPRVQEVMISLSGSYEVVMILSTDGTWAADVRPLVYISIRVIAEEKGKRGQGSGGGGMRGDYKMFFAEDTALQYIKKAVGQAIHNLNADSMFAGMMPVVLGPGWPAVLLHEAIGHGLEGDFNRKGSSAFSDRMGQKVASDLCTIVDDGTIPGRRGSISIDDEGTPSHKTVLIEKGILKNYMLDKHNAKLMKMKPTGNGRRQSYSHLPLPRMTNTYMLPGNSDPGEIIASVDRGLYAVDFSGGQVDITSGKFVFTASEAYLIEKGKITRPVKGASLIGNGPDILTRVSMVGNDLKLDSGIGHCGKAGQTIPVGVGQPTLKIDAMTVGGEEQ